FEPMCERAAGRVGEKLLRSPKCDGGGSGAGTLQRDFSEMEILGREVGVGGVVFIEAADGGGTEEDTAAAVGLEAMFVRVDDDGVGVRNGIKGGAGLGRQICREGEVTTVGGVDVNAEAVFLLESDDLIERIDGANGGRA